MKLSTKWTLTLIAAVVPIVLLCICGLIWLVGHQLILEWLGIAAITSLIFSIAIRRIQKQESAPIPLNIDPSNKWNQTGQTAWKMIEDLSLTIQQKEAEYNSPEALWEILKTVMKAVSEHFYPNHPDALWEIRIPELLKVIELLSKDLRITFSQHVPGSHILTISDVMKGQRMFKKAKWLYDLYRIVSVGIDPISAAIREIKGAAFDSLLQSSTKDVKLWLLDAYVKKIGYYAIELYCGNIPFDEEQLKTFVTSETVNNLKQEQKRNEIIESEPLRIMVVGQVKAGKSSLINALFGQVKTATDVIPVTKGVQPFRLERDGIDQAIILDTAGYDESNRSSKFEDELAKEARTCDLIILVCSAVSATREADRRVLEQFKNEFQKQMQDELPIIVVLSHIDQLRPFREWNPPYNIANPDSMKASMIRTAMETVSDDFKIDISRVVPVNLKTGQEYNIEEGLIPAMLSLMDESRRIKYLRCLRQYKDEEKWQLLWTQAKETGRIIIQKGAKWVVKKIIS